MLKKELSDEYFASVQDHLRELKFREGVLISAELGEGNKGCQLLFSIRPRVGKEQSWMERIFAKKRRFTPFISAIAMKAAPGPWRT